jgi:hypothetical protein
MSVILTPDQRLRVFIAALTPELAEERAAAERSIRALRLSPVAPEFPDGGAELRHFYDSYIDQSHIFVGIYGSHYGAAGMAGRLRCRGRLPARRGEAAPALRIALALDEEDRAVRPARSP